MAAPRKTLKKLQVQVVQKPPRKPRQKNLSPYNAAIIGLLQKMPQAQLVGNDKQTAERMVKLGWLQKTTAKRKESAGVYEYEVDVPIYAPTQEGLELYGQRALHYMDLSSEQLHFASRLTSRVERLCSTYSSREKAAEKINKKK